MTAPGVLIAFERLVGLTSRGVRGWAGAFLVSVSLWDG